MRGFIAFMSGLIFAIGLVLSGMTQPHIVKGFLDILGEWNGSLILVMGGAIAVHALLYRLSVKRGKPVFENEFKLPQSQLIDRKLILGSILFGLGWGWAGICPGPGIVSLMSLNLSFVYFVLAMLVGMKIYQNWEKRG